LLAVGVELYKAGAEYEVDKFLEFQKAKAGADWSLGAVYVIKDHLAY